MTRAEFSAQWERLGRAFPDARLSVRDIAGRLEVYWQELRWLTEGQWCAMVTKAIRESRFFPACAELLDLVPRGDVLMLPAPRRGPEELEAARTEAREGLRLIEAAVMERAKHLPPMPIVSRPIDGEVRLSDERWDLLKRQAVEIQK